ncbi:MAG: cell shape determination protein CcmA [Gallionellales bacterium RIFOXYB12_FULL_54_9]|nr:MAG: cell shape determination protein CcmA [Gallionellales bacterium RIFOXYB12_FULL_54_9]
MFKKKYSKPQNRIDTLIGAGTVIEGDVTFVGGMRVDGRVNGNVIAVPGNPSTLVLSEQGSINGEVVATHMVLSGEIIGAATASEYLELHAKARLLGDVHYKMLEIQLGAVLEGRLIHINEGEQEQLVAFHTSINQ